MFVFSSFYFLLVVIFQTLVTNVNFLQLGQELNWAGRPYKTKNMLPPVRDQRGQPGKFVKVSTHLGDD